jgi:hypothetical protein
VGIVNRVRRKPLKPLKYDDSWLIPLRYDENWLLPGESWAPSYLIERRKNPNWRRMMAIWALLTSESDRLYFDPSVKTDHEMYILLKPLYEMLDNAKMDCGIAVRYR